MKVIDEMTSTGRVYSRECLESAVNDMKERLKEHTIVGELGHLTMLTQATVDGYGEVEENGEVKKFEIIAVNLIPMR